MDAETYKLKADALFKVWKNEEPSGEINHRDGVFIRDGVADPDMWFSQPVRPLYLLKEAYGGNADWDLISFILGDPENCSFGKSKSTWTKISDWTEGLLNTTEEHIHPFLAAEENELPNNHMLHHIAVVNIKKSGGEKSSNIDEINRYAEYDKDMLKQEILLCDPTIIVCGYTISFLNIIMGTKVKDYAHPNQNATYWMKINDHDVLVMDYYHPANRYPEALNYYGLVCEYQQALIHKPE